jgi:hypothetical protein
VEWTTKRDSTSNFSVELTPTNSKNGDLLVNTIIATGLGTTQIYNANGDYFFDVSGGDSWTLKVSPL